LKATKKSLGAEGSVREIGNDCECKSGTRDLDNFRLEIEGCLCGG
jgi:hypothetical protein